MEITNLILEVFLNIFIENLRQILRRVPNNSKFACQKGQFELYFKFKAKNLSKNYIFRNPLKINFFINQKNLK